MQQVLVSVMERKTPCTHGTYSEARVTADKQTKNDYRPGRCLCRALDWGGGVRRDGRGVWDEWQNSFLAAVLAALILK